jgi:tRNA-dihydrouridine synthase
MISQLKSVAPTRTQVLPQSIVSGHWPTALAPMQDVTGLPFMEVVSARGAPDYFFTEFFRVHASSRLSPDILSSITENPTNQPVFAQLIGENIDDLRRTVKEFRKYSVSGIDLNLGCPAPRVFKKNVGGGLLRTPKKVFEILKMLRDEVETLLTVKMRIGFEDDRFFEELLTAININNVDMLSLHARTVTGGYRSSPSYDHVKKAVRLANCPVLLNGNVSSYTTAKNLRDLTGAFGVMIGRGAIRNPWIFRQIRELQSGESIFLPKLGDVYEYVKDLYHSLSKPGVDELKRVARMKKFLNFIGVSIDADGKFLYKMRRARTEKDLFSVCENFLVHKNKQDCYFNLEPFEGLVARPSSESTEQISCF